MSKNVKYISSDHFDAPQLKGDSFGYGINLLRKALCEGFNIRSNITSVEVVSEYIVVITYSEPHMYTAVQTILLEGININALNTEYFITDVTQLSVTLKSYESLLAHIGINISNPPNVTTKVAPLGWIEKYSDTYRGAFTTDEEEAYLVFDDREQDNWPKTNENRGTIEPLVYMTDSLTDIDTPGRTIVPYDSANPTYYNTSYIANTYSKTGLWCWPTFGRAAVAYNTPAEQAIPIKYAIIGNGRMFYYLPTIKTVGATATVPSIYFFGKFSNERQILSRKNYVLFARPQNLSYQQHNSNRLVRDFICVPNSYLNVAAYVTTDTGNNCAAMLSYNNKPTAVLFTNQKVVSLFTNTTNNNVSISGKAAHIKYPEVNTNNMYISTMHISNGSDYIGKLSGLKWTYNVDDNIHKNGMIYKYPTENNTFKYLYCFRTNCNINGAAYYSDTTYKISLDNKDWYNYD